MGKLPAEVDVISPPKHHHSGAEAHAIRVPRRAALCRRSAHHSAAEVDIILQHTQVDTLTLLECSQTPYLVGLKANQPTLYAMAKQLYDHTIPIDIVTEYDPTHSRQVQRTVRVYPVPADMPQRWNTAGIQRIIWIRREGIRHGKSFDEGHCYLSNRRLDAETYMTQIREHWQIENGLHWVKDVTFQEDDPPRRGGHAPISWAVLHSFFITIARQLSYHTIPEAMRALANRLDKIFPLLT